MIPSTDKISATFDKVYISPFTSGEMFHASLRTIQSGIEAGEIYNPEFQSAKSWIARGCEQSQHIAAELAQNGQRYGDCRDDIGYAFNMNQAAKLSRNLKKLSADKITPGIIDYIATLDQIDAVWKWLQTVKPIIKKGRKPAANPKPIDLTNTAHCAICEKRFKLERHGKRAVVHHGFSISDGMGHYFGHRAGKCFGTGFEPYELSNQANVHYKYFLEQELKDAQRYLAELQASVPDTLGVQEYQKGIRYPVTVNYGRGTKEYEKERQHRIWQVESEIRTLKTQIPYQQVRIDTWKKQELPD